MADIEKIIIVLRQVAKNHHLDKYDIEIKPISSEGANYTSNIYNVIIKDDSNILNLFVKVAAMGQTARSDSPQVFDTEIYAYTKLMIIYDDLQNKYEVSQEHRMEFPKFYACNSEVFEEVLVLENLAIKGYQSYDRFKPIDWEYAASAVTEMAKMHALSFAYCEYYPVDFINDLVKLKIECDMENGNLAQLFKKSSLKAIDMVEDETKEKLTRFFDTYGIFNFPKFLASCKPVLSHGDFRPSNLLHKILDDGKLDIKICDLQTIQGASPVVDLIYFIYTGSDEMFRAQYFEKLLAHYYSELNIAMKRLHLDPEKVYSKAEFDEELKEKLPFGLTVAVLLLPIIAVDIENGPKVNDDINFNSFSLNHVSTMYTERLSGVINEFVKFGILV